MKNYFPLLIVLMTVFMTSACAHYTINQPIETLDTSIFKPTAQEKSDELYIVLAFSGGGTRAASLSYGVLEALDRVEMPVSSDREGAGSHTLLDEVDMISSVSGGSVTASYYALYGKQIFSDFKEVFLYRNVNRALFLQMLSPISLIRLSSRHYGRSDFAAEYYDELLFHGATFGDLADRNTPGLFIQATDIADGTYFGFTPGYFNLICSDLNSYPISRAVAASAAFPGPFGPITLKNYAGTCGFERPAWVVETLEKRDTSSRLFNVANHLNSYLDKNEKAYVHLVDGGVADNLALRGPLEVILGRGGLQETLEKLGRKRVHRVAFLIVNAEKQIKTGWGLRDVGPGILKILGMTSSIMISSYNYETIDLLRQYAAKWSAEGEKPIEFYAIEVAFSALRDEGEREYFSRIPTSFNLPDEEVDELIDVAKRILYDSEDFQKLVRDLGGKMPAPMPTEENKEVIEGE